MAQQVLNVGEAPNTRTGDPLRDAMIKVNDNFTELYSRTATIVIETPLSIKTKYESNDDTNAFTDALKEKLENIEQNATADMSGAELVAAIDTELATTSWRSLIDGGVLVGILDTTLGSTAWRSGGGSALTGNSIVALIDDALGSTVWQLGGGVPDGSDLVDLINAELGSTAWQGSGPDIISAIDNEIGETWKGVYSIKEIDTNPYVLQEEDLTGNKCLLIPSGAIEVPAGLPFNQPVVIVNTGTGTVSFIGTGGANVFGVDNRFRLRAQYSSATLLPMGSNNYVLVGDIT